MNPVDFPEKTRILQRPSSMTEEECSPLAIYNNLGNTYCLSCWEPDWKERLSILFYGKVWLWVYSRQTQPPVALSGVRTVFKEN